MPKLKLIFILLITTTIILISSIPLSVFAYTEAVYEPAATAEITHYVKNPTTGAVTSVTSSTPRLLKSQVNSGVNQPWIACDGTIENARQYDYYYASQMNVYDDSSYLQEVDLIFDYSINDFSNFNSFSFDIGVFGHVDDPSDRFNYRVTATSDDVTVDLPFVITYGNNWSTTSNINGVTKRWQWVRINVFLNKVYSYDTVDLKFYVNSTLPAWGDTPVTYLFGASDMTAKLMDEQDWVTEIAGSVVEIGTKLDDTNTQLGIIGDTANDIKDKVTEAVDVLTQDLSPEQQQKVDSVIDSIETRAEAEDVVIGDVNNVFESFNNIDYDPFDDVFKDSYKDAVEPLWSSPFGDFWNLFWLDPTIMVFVLIALGFSIAGFVLYGVR